LGIGPAGPNVVISVGDAETLNKDNIFECMMNMVFLIVFHAALYGNKELHFAYKRASVATPNLKTWVILNQVLYYIQFSKLFVFRFERWSLKNATIWTAVEMLYQTVLIIGFGSSVWGGKFAELAKEDAFLYNNLKNFLTFMIIFRITSTALKILSLFIFSRNPEV
jgi:hypothetical protein